MGDRLELVVDRLAADGEGIATAPDGRVVFVRTGAPGDRVDVELTRVRSRSLHGFVQARLADGPDRVPAFCPVVEQCGGCPWQGIDRAAQRAALSRHVSTLLSRAVGSPVEVPVEAVEPGEAWRATTRLHWQNGRIGFHEARSPNVLDVAACAVLAPPLPALLTAVRRHLAPVLVGEGDLRLSARPGAASGTVHIETHGSAALEAAARALANDPACHGVVLAQAFGAALVLGQPFNEINGVPHQAQAFVQAHPVGAAALVRAVIDRLGPPPGPVLELYAGSGAFTLPLAEAGYAVTAVELQGVAARSLAAEVERRKLPVQVVAGGAQRQPPGGFPWVILDPPRAGAPEAVAALARRAGLRRMIYVACDPATLARDVAHVIGRGWHLADARAFELFPHTGHVETVVVLERHRMAP